MLMLALQVTTSACVTSDDQDLVSGLTDCLEKTDHIQGQLYLLLHVK